MKHQVYTVFLEHKDDELEKKFLRNLADLEVDGYTIRIFRAEQLERKQSPIIKPDGGLSL